MADNMHKPSEESLLDEVARDLYMRCGEKIGEVKIIAPSRRARVFFARSLANISPKPIWEPEAVEIQSVMCGIAGVELGERLRLVTELFKIYQKYHTTESFDKFYHWGEVLISDFDMIDKYMINAKDIFRNISDIKELESDVSYLTPEQMQIILSFWRSVADARSDLDLSEYKRRFLVVWRSLLPIYEEYRERLLELGVAYSGMIYRLAAERILQGEWIAQADEQYAIVGFNALSSCEKVLFDELKRSAKIYFYWDWDDYYCTDSVQEAGLFIKDNSSRYSSAAEISHDNFARAKDVEVVACSSTALQCKYVAKIIEDIVARDGCIDRKTAIVLTDESLLLPLLYALPKDIDGVNVTMGYPLRQSLAYSFLERLLELQSHARSSRSTGEQSFYHLDVVGLLSHPYIASGVAPELLAQLEREIGEMRLIMLSAERFERDELLREIFTVAESWQERSNYLVRVVRAVAALPFDVSREAEMRVEFLSFILDHIVQLHNAIVECDVQMTTSTYISLLRRHLQSLRIPFEGEPLEGVQIMGILETRTLDFDNVILLSMNDDNFPGSRALQPSYIPYSLRSAYSLPTPEHHDGVYAYYFYRLIQRAKNISMLYCSRADERSTGEQSRYITQLELESAMKISRVDVGVEVNLFKSEPIEVEKRGVVAERLRKFTSESDVVGRDGVVRREIRRLSPTALFQYLACPLRFYYSSIANIREDDELSEEVDAPMFGNILHDAMQHLYKPISESDEIVEKQLKAITKEDVEAATLKAICLKYLRKEESQEPLSGNLQIVKEVVESYIWRGVLRYDLSAPPKRILSVERNEEYFLDLSDTQRVRFYGVCDRVDLLASGALNIIDYKSGSAHLEFNGIERLFNGESKDRQSNIFQTLLYSYMLRKDASGKLRSVTPMLYYVRAMQGEEYSPKLCCEGEPVESYESLHDEFESHLLELLRELFDESTPFRQCADSASCSYCDFNRLCRRDTE